MCNPVYDTQTDVTTLRYSRQSSEFSSEHIYSDPSNHGDNNGIYELAQDYTIYQEPELPSDYCIPNRHQ